MPHSVLSIQVTESAPIGMHPIKPVYIITQNSDLFGQKRVDCNSV